MISLSLWIILAVTLCVYLPHLSNPFIYDDLHSLVWNPALRDWSQLAQMWVDPSLFSADPDKPMYRPLLLFSYLLSGGSSGPALWHRLANLLIHLQVGAMVYLLALRWHGRHPARWALALFLLHPAFSEPVFYISSRSESMMALYVLMVLWTYWHNRQLGAALFLGLALLSKESAVVALPLILWFDWCIYPFRVSRTYALLKYGPLAAITAGYLWLSWHWGLLRGAGTRVGRSAAEQLWTQATALRDYAQALVWPSAWGIEGTAGVYAEPSLSALVGLALAAGSLWWAWLQRPRLGNFPLFLIGAAWICFLPTTIVPLNIVMTERRLYLSGVFLCIGAGAMMTELTKRSAKWGVALVVLLGVLATLTYQRGSLWGEPEKAWAQSVKAQSTFRALVNHGTAAAQEGHYEDAIISLKRAVAAAEDRSQQAMALSNLGGAYFSSGKLDEAMACYVGSIQSDSLRAETWANLGVLWFEMGKKSAGEDRKVRWQGAGAYLSHAIKLDPESRQARLGLANLFYAIGKKEEAERERALAAGAPDNQVLVPLTGP